MYFSIMNDARVSLFRSVMVVVLLLLCIDSSYSTLPPLIRRKVLFGNPDQTEPRVSPDGKKISYLAPHKGVMNLWVRGIEEDSGEVITGDSIRGIGKYYWAQDNRHILFLQDNGGENYKLYSVGIDSRQIKPIGEHTDVQIQILGTDRKFPDLVLLAMNLRNKKCLDVFTLSISTGEEILAAENPGDVITWITDTNFVVRAALAVTKDGGYELRVRDDNKSAWRPIAEWTAHDGIPRIDGFTEDNNHLFVEDGRNWNANRLVELSMSDGTVKIIASDSSYDVAQVLISPVDRHVQGVSFYKDRESWKSFDSLFTKDLALQIVYWSDLSIISRSNSDSIWIIKMAVDNSPSQYFLYNNATRVPTFLFYDRPGLKKYKLSNMSPTAILSRDSMMLYGYMSFPDGIEPDSLPVVVLVHDGPWKRDIWDMNPLVQWITNRGWLCLQINFRGSTGYGKKFLNAGNREWGAKMQDDLADAVNYFVDQGVADPKRVAIMGESYGGYAALAGAAFAPGRYVCAIDINGPANLISFQQSAPTYMEPMKKIFSARTGDPKKDQAMLKKRSPFFNVEKINTPLLIVQGANDPIVRQSESDAFVKALKAKKKDVRYVLFPDEGHSIVHPVNKLKFYEAAEDFLAKYLGGRTE